MSDLQTENRNGEHLPSVRTSTQNRTPEARITSVRLIEVTGTLPAGAGMTTLPQQSRPASVYPDRLIGVTRLQHRDRPLNALYLEIGTDGGHTGFYGPVDREVIAPLTAGIARQLLGLDALGGSFVWDLLNRSNRHARHGAYKIAISAVDNALWDLRGKIAGLPVWQLLGGGGRSSIPAYASTLGETHEEGAVERVAAELVEQGYAGQKWFFANGPGQGADGLARNIALAERARAGAGPRSGLMFDAFMSWDVSHAQAWCTAVEHLRPDWLEEPFAPGDIESYARLQAGTRVPLATGEHFYDRQDMLPYLTRRILAVVQCDPEWCGGVTELARMADLADSFGVPLVPHGHGLHAALHVVASRSPQVCPRLEYLYLVEEERHWFEIDPPQPRNGQFDLPTAPGFAIELDPSRVESTTELFAVE